MDTRSYVANLLTRATAARGVMATLRTEIKDKVLRDAGNRMLARATYLKEENRKDTENAARTGMAPAMIDRLLLTDKRIEAMARALFDVAALPDPVGEVIEGYRRPNGLRIQRVRIPIGVVVVIYESRPNVTADAAALCFKSGNVAILRGGKEALHSNLAIHSILAEALSANQVDPAAIQLVETADRGAVEHLIAAEGAVDLVIPRGGESLIRAIAEKAKVPVIKHYKGVCHTFVDASADIEMAVRICMNAKVQRPAVCNAMETMLVHRAIAAAFLPRIGAELRAAGVEIRGCPETLGFIPDGKRATEDDWYAEYLDLILAVRVVDSLQTAIEHIERYGSHHSDAIVTRDRASAQAFVERVDSAAVFVNCSTRFHDGGEFGLGAEIGISTDRLHARGPMGLRELTTYKFVVEGDGQVRT